MTKKVLILCYSDHSKEPRLLMQCSALKKAYSITTAGFQRVNDPDVGFIKLTNQSKKAFFSFHSKLPAPIRLPFSLFNRLQFKVTGNSLVYSAQDYKVLKNEPADLIICHHPASLELAFKLREKYKCRLIFNAHEIYPYEFEENKAWMEKNFEPIDHLLKKFLHRCDAVFSVNKEICDFYTKTYNARCVPVHNSKPFYDLPVTPVASPIRVIHHGGAMQRRKLEQMAEAVIDLGGKYELTFMLVKNTNDNYLNELKEKYEPKGIRFVDAVPYNKIIGAINNFDIGLYILPNDNINQQLALPNKLFEFIQARLAVVASPNPAMKNIIVNNNVGCVADGFEVKDMVKLLKELTPEKIMAFKEQSGKVSRQLSDEQDEKRVFETVKELLN